jgi:LysR family transcriptional activator of nhaA
MAADWLNYHHLQYFWMVAREGSIVRAAEALGISQPTISLQLQELERAAKCKLFERKGRNLLLTEQGRMVYKYAEEIFSLGWELAERVREHPKQAGLRLAVGVSDQISRIGMGLMLEPALRGHVKVVCREDRLDRLLPEVAGGRLDAVLSNEPSGAGTRVRVFDHFIGQCDVHIFVNYELAHRLEEPFPQSLNGFPMIVPTESSPLRRQLDQWLRKHKLRPDVVAEIEDPAIIVTLGCLGNGAYPSPSIIGDALRRKFQSEVIGVAEGVVEKFYAITAGHEVTHPGVKLIRDEARDRLFGDEEGKVVSENGARTKGGRSPEGKRADNGH